MNRFAILCSIALVSALAGCRSAPPHSATTQPSGATANSSDFDRLMNATDDVSRNLLFKPAVQDYRAGLYRTQPMMSAQWFEFWRCDVRTAEDAAESSLAKVRRTLSVRIEKDVKGNFIARPQVLVERYSLAERRLTTAAGYRSIYSERYRPTGNSLTDAGIAAPDAYWYTVGSDPELERYVAKMIEERANSQRS